MIKNETDNSPANFICLLSEPMFNKVIINKGSIRKALAMQISIFHFISLEYCKL